MRWSGRMLSLRRSSRKGQWSSLIGSWEIYEQQTEMKTLVLLSGGMDSVTALHWAAREHEVVGTVSFDYGSKHNGKEIPMAAWQAAKLGVPHEVIALDFVNRLFASDLLQSGGEIPDG